MQMIYVADDEQDIRNLVSDFLVNAGFDVRSFTTGDELYAAFRERASDLIILDIMMPGTDGLEICRKIRAISNVPIIILTARNAETDHLRGFALGGDDYVIKPFSPVVLLARVNAILRRVNPEASANNAARFGDLLFSAEERKVYCVHNDLGMTLTEFALFSCLMEKPGSAVSREALLSRVWGIDSQSIQTRVIDETVRRIRQKLKGSGSHVRIASEWGYGYRLEDSNE